MVLWGMNPPTSRGAPAIRLVLVSAGRVSAPIEPGKLRMEADVPEDTAVRLASTEHDIAGWPKWSWSAGGACVIMRDPERKVFIGGADPRREGYVVASECSGARMRSAEERAMSMGCGAAGDPARAATLRDRI